MELTGRWKTLFAWGVIAVAGLIYLASLLPVVAAMEEGGVVVSDQLPSSLITVSTTITGTGEPEADTAAADMETSMTERDTGLATQFSASSYTAPPEDETVVIQKSATDSETTKDPGNEELKDLEDATPTESGETAPAEPEDTPPESGDPAPTEPEVTEPTDPDPTGELDPADPAEEVIEPVEPTPAEILASFIASRLGLVSAGTTFPIHDVDTTGEFVFHTSAISGSNFSAAKGRSIPSGFSALTTYGNGTMSGFELYKDMRHDPHYGDCHIAMSADGSVSFNNLAMEVTELYGQQLMGVRLFPLVDFWTTNPGEDLPLGGDETPLPMDLPFYGDDFKVTVIKMTADHIEIPNFSLSVAPGKKQLEG
jgi:hypothetical protein